MQGALKQSTLMTMIAIINIVDPKLLEAVQPETGMCLLHVVVHRSVAIPYPSLLALTSHTFTLPHLTSPRIIGFLTHPFTRTIIHARMHLHTYSRTNSLTFVT